MAKDPAFLFYSSDFLAGTFTMSNEQIGKYIRLLCLQHQKGFLSEKDMMNICSTYDEDIWNKFEKTEEGFFNKRLKEESEKRARFTESRRNNRKSNNASLKEDTSYSCEQHMNNICSTSVEHMENRNENRIINKNKNNFEKGCGEKLLSIQVGEQVNQIFDFYRCLFDRPRYQLTDKRKQKIISRLGEKPTGMIYFARDRTLEIICSMCAVALSPFHMGDNDNKKIYIELEENCLRSCEQVEKWIYDLAENPEKLEKTKKMLEKNGVLKDEKINIL